MLDFRKDKLEGATPAVSELRSTSTKSGEESGPSAAPYVRTPDSESRNFCRRG